MVPCFPLHALLAALNRSTVDYFSLDVEGVELEVGVMSNGGTGTDAIDYIILIRVKRSTS